MDSLPPRVRSLVQPVGVFLFASLLYLPLLSIQYNPNGINEAINVEIGGKGLFSPNHLAYRPVGVIAWKAARGLGYEGRSLGILQCLSAVAGALAVTFSFVAFRRLTGRFWPAAVGATFLATTNYFWASCVDAFYIAPAAALAAATLAVTADREPAVTSLLSASVLTSAAVLVWQANVFLVLPIAIGFISGPTRINLRRRLIGAVSYTVATITVIGLSYVMVGFLVFRRRSVTSVIDWISSYAGAQLPQWGTWESSRVPAAVGSAFQSLVPLRMIGGLKGIRERGFALDSLVVTAGLAALLLLMVLAVLAVGQSDALSRWLARFGWLGIGYLGFIPFIVWWDPFEPKWFVVPNVFLAGLVAGALAEVEFRRGGRLVFVCCVAVLALSTLAMTIWPQHVKESSRQRGAACVAEHMERRDVLIATDWKWNAYLSYFHGIQVVSAIGLAPRLEGPEALVEAIQARVIEVRAAGASAYMVDPSHYSRGYLTWLESQTGLTGSMLDSLVGERAFVCEGVALLRLEEPR